MAENAKPRIVRVGRYDLHAKIASGGMAAVHIGRFAGPVGSNRTVAIKRLHPAFAAEPELVVSMLIDEAHLAARIRHANVVQTLDTVTVDDEVFVVMEVVPGESLAALVSRATKTHEPTTAAIASALVGGLLQPRCPTLRQFPPTHARWRTRPSSVASTPPGASASATPFPRRRNCADARATSTRKRTAFSTSANAYRTARETRIPEP